MRSALFIVAALAIAVVLVIVAETGAKRDAREALERRYATVTRMSGARAFQMSCLKGDTGKTHTRRRYDYRAVTPEGAHVQGYVCAGGLFSAIIHEGED